ncbi:hypothetical protein ZHAS_00016471 [Anopheles sinensis]|uniref:Uncharacterized protein n=1 Tax=Anopheles sinensis TaxID=74873 RepID=A0A084WE41_ANOSI|nr:hypothetical protein ZHAS_00016471 [Anopheles sinensis]
MENQFTGLRAGPRRAPKTTFPALDRRMLFRFERDRKLAVGGPLIQCSGDERDWIVLSRNKQRMEKKGGSVGEEKERPVVENNDSAGDDDDNDSDDDENECQSSQPTGFARRKLELSGRKEGVKKDIR